MAAGDASHMADVWVRDPSVSTQHPIGGRDEGYETVIASFAKVAKIEGGGEITLLDQKVDVESDMAIETGRLVIAGHQASIHHRVTNV